MIRRWLKTAELVGLNFSLLILSLLFALLLVPLTMLLLVERPLRRRKHDVASELLVGATWRQYQNSQKRPNAHSTDSSGPGTGENHV